MIDHNQVTIVFQGGINPSALGTYRDDGSDFLYNVARTKSAFPTAQIVLSTWDNIMLPEAFDSADKLGIDQLIVSPDPGGLPNIKFGYDTPNNVNRQIVSSQAGLNKVTTAFAMKLRADSFLTSDTLLSVYENYRQQVQSLAKNTDYSPIMVPHLFTIDPSVYEHMAYHVSDWAQFGETATLQQYWSAKWMSEDNARYFEQYEHDAKASYGNNAFRTRLAVEQHIATQYAQVQGYPTPNQYNEITPEIIKGHRDFLAKQVIVLDTQVFGLSLPKYAWALNDDFMRLNCVSHDDWYQLFSEHWQLSKPDIRRLANAEKRQQEKITARQVFEQQLKAEKIQSLSQLYP